MADSVVEEKGSSITQRKYSYLPLQMLVDKKTEMYIKFAKAMVIFQGHYSEDRSAAIKGLGKKFEYASRTLSDETYRSESRLMCLAENTEEFYEYFKLQSRKGLEEGNNLLVIDPTMSHLTIDRYYLALAHRMQYVVLVMPPVVMPLDRGVQSKFPWPKNSQAASFRELDTFIHPANKFQHLFCGWFLHDVDSFELRHEAALYAQDCFEGIPHFKQLFEKVCIVEEKSKLNKKPEDDDETSLPTYCDAYSKNSVEHKFVKYFNLDRLRQDLAYCPTKICNTMKTMNDYFKSEEVIKNYGKMSKLYIAGFIFSPHMVAARVKLSHHQKELWDMEEEMDESSPIVPICPYDLYQESKAELPKVEVQLISTKSNRTLMNSGREVHEPTESIHKFAKGRACHFVLGKAPNAPSRNVDYDVQFALRRYKNALKAKNDIESDDLERCIVNKIGKYYYVYLKEMVSIEGLFASCVKPYPYENAI